jgi:hypothetical protein
MTLAIARRKQYNEVSKSFYPGGFRMKFKFFAVILILSILFVVPGCGPNMSTATAVATAPPLAATAPPLFTTGPCTSVNDLQAAFNLSPLDYDTVSSLTPTLSWDYPDTLPSGASGCLPDNYHVTLSTGPFFTDIQGFITGGSGTSWTPPSLQPGMEYRFSVEPMIGGVIGPFAGYNHFFTPGTDCASANLIAPTLLYPADGAVITTDTPTLIWDYADTCVPKYYWIGVGNIPNFIDPSDPNYSGGLGTTTNNPSTYWTWQLNDCTTYWWKVSASNGQMLSPYSSTFSFKIDMTGSCSPAQPPAPIISYCPAYTDLQACTNDPDCIWWASNYGQSGNCANR